MVEELGKSILADVKKVDLLVSKTATTALLGTDVPFSQAGVLKYLAQRKGQETSNRQIEKYFGISNPAVSGLVKRLSAKEYVVSRVGENDKRFHSVEITDAGMQAYLEVEDKIDNINDRIFDGFTEDEKAEAFRLIAKMVNNLS